jgi:ParB family transcriptional regulator, chromosome partitioning protein
MYISIDEIRIKKRVRTDEGDLYSLMYSLKKFGQLNPIVVDARYELIAGARRLAAAKRLGWSTIKAIVVENPTDAEKLEIELEENIQRKDLTNEEIARGNKRLHKLLHPNIFMRIIYFIRKIFRLIFRRKRRV